MMLHVQILCNLIGMINGVTHRDSMLFMRIIHAVTCRDSMLSHEDYTCCYM